MEWVKRSRPLIGRGRMRYGTRENEKCMRVFVGTGTWVRGPRREGVALAHGSPALGPHWARKNTKEEGGGGEGSLRRRGPPVLGRGVSGTSLPIRRGRWATLFRLRHVSR